MKSRRHFLTLVSFLLTLPVSSPTEGLQIRLAGPGSTGCSGRVEIYKNNTWGTICDKKWSLYDAKVVCRQLGCGKIEEASTAARFGKGTGKIWLSHLECLGNEKSLSDCKHKEYGGDDCSHSRDAGVICPLIKLNRSDRCSGKVVIYHNNRWGTVCDNSWDLKDAEVVCRHLNCGTAMAATQGACFGEPYEEITVWLDRVACSGSEDSLTECQHSGFEKTVCSHSKDAGVVCSESVPKPSISVYPSAEVSWGQNVSITCSISAEHKSGTYILKKSTGSFREKEKSSSNSAIFRIHPVDFDDEGSYQCQYQRNIANERFSSALSDPVRLSVTVPLSLLFSSIAGGILLLLLLVLVVCLVRRRRGGKARQPGALTLSQLTVTARNKFEDDVNHDYINFDSGEINKELTEEVGKLADDVYEKPESDEDHLYDVVGPSNLDVKSKEVCASVEENREDEEEDDENDYIDVTLPF
ncbi:deleted in malignant brain tumors 1 protein isoform X1 [Hippoglossus stenolepis]|uniref:deleted in malignant brain tumors 1 protein isoform X1 n=1 Tax=Hippoglossus stenolepis TaxID=195615 RepID=UPI00159C4838|nr:deleted in malignant brain tumors 1 protein isoform X1 [Hippoglossus stenolepis]